MWLLLYVHSFIELRTYTPTLHSYWSSVLTDNTLLYTLIYFNFYILYTLKYTKTLTYLFLHSHTTHIPLTYHSHTTHIPLTYHLTYFFYILIPLDSIVISFLLYTSFGIHFYLYYTTLPSCLHLHFYSLHLY